MTWSFLLFDSPWLIAAALLLILGLILLELLRPISVPLKAKWFALAGALLLGLGVAGPSWPRQTAREVAVLVDCSASTRGASFRDRALLNARLSALLGSTPYRVYRFADGFCTPDTGQGPFTDQPCDRTALVPPPAAAILLFSDGQFALPTSAPPTFAVVDADLLSAVDARVANLEVIGKEVDATVDVPITGRVLNWAGTNPPGDVAMRPGRLHERRSIDGSRPIVVGLSPGDRWPENDQLAIVPLAGDHLERWFVSSERAAPPGFRLVRPTALPEDLASYLSAAVIVLDNLPADVLSPTCQDRLAGYVRQAGGGLIILGGDHAFAAGGYVGTSLEILSPLASSPPRPATKWILLTDGSGSMSAAVEGGSGVTAWQVATSALLHILPKVPSGDPVDLGSFADHLTWWSRGKPAGATMEMKLPPTDIAPGGQTNLRDAVLETARQQDSTLPANLLLLTDADADLGNVDEMIALLNSKRIRLHVLAVGQGRGLADLKRIVSQTSGRLLTQQDASRWAEAVADLLRSASEGNLINEKAQINFRGELIDQGTSTVSNWNRTWIKPRAIPLAETSHGGEEICMVGTWQFGEGRVTAAAMQAEYRLIERLSLLVVRSPVDPRISVSTEQGSDLRIRVDAVDPNPNAREPFLNALPITVDFTGDGALPQASPVPQVGPGRYEAYLPSLRRSAVATVRVAGRPIHRLAIAGRYAPEFERIGIDRANLDRLAGMTGGGVIEPNENNPIDFRWPREAIDLTSWVTSAGAVLLGVALLLWKMR